MNVEEVHVVTCFLERDGRVALFRRSSMVGSFQGCWAGVSGYLEEGATPRSQALTEIMEETGLTEADVELAAAGDVVEVAEDRPGRKWLVHPFRFAVKQAGKITLDWEHTEFQWMDPGRIGSLNTVPGLAEVWKSVAGDLAE